MDLSLEGGPVPTHPSQLILDSSKIQQYQKCPRAYFFKYVLGWQKRLPSIHLVFGSAWHEAMEHLLNNGYTGKSVSEAYQKFMDRWYQEAGEDLAALDHAYKNPAAAFEALVAYAQRYKSDQSQYNILFTETAGTVPIQIDPVRLIHFKLDSMLQKVSDGTIWSMEHKTTGRADKRWYTSWEVLTQVGCYNHVLHILAPEPEQAKGVIINGAVFKKEIEFLRIYEVRSGSKLSEWLWEVNTWIDLIERDHQILRECDVEQVVMPCFPKNGPGCSASFYGCSHPEFCAWANPLRNLDRKPYSYKLDFWDPRRHEEEVGNVVHIDPSSLISTTQ